MKLLLGSFKSLSYPETLHSIFGDLLFIIAAKLAANRSAPVQSMLSTAARHARVAQYVSRSSLRRTSWYGVVAWQMQEFGTSTAMAAQLVFVVPVSWKV